MSTSLRDSNVTKQSINGFYPSKKYPDKLRRIRYYNSETDKDFTFLTNNFSLPAMTITQLYKCRCQIEPFFKWIKHHLKIKSFYGTSENALKTQIWIAISVYLLVAIVKKPLKIKAPLYTSLQILSVTPFEKIPILQLLRDNDYKNINVQITKQLFLFD
ncbi:transposase [candidate division KSB1 bacterium]|nr:transposase [candidate division KSB1 bacterium]NIR69457.1 transposase [candidate division KSB1 bacterium]NIT69646.1 transposase [candidate division KSB1 bacterium]NIU23315.1 transposase [candidate division KSB1 bacterium]NIU90538.1 transposase [candidate division KSB1 bacterium]